MRSSKPYINVTSDFINKIKCNNSLPRDANLGRVDVVGLNLSIPYKTGLKTLRQKDILKTFQLKILLKKRDLF